MRPCALAPPVARASEVVLEPGSISWVGSVPVAVPTNVRAWAIGVCWQRHAKNHTDETDSGVHILGKTDGPG
jgi:hypothetical protein